MLVNQNVCYYYYYYYYLYTQNSYTGLDTIKINSCARDT